MKLIVSDLPLQIDLSAIRDAHFVDLASLNISPCIGCFGCWVKTPGKCVIRDDAVSVYPLIARSETLIYVSHVQYGGYGTVMKAMLERSIPIQKAFLRLHQGETHHVQRRVAQKDAVIFAYGDIPPEEQELFLRLVERNAKNMSFRSYRVHFVSRSELEQAVGREVAEWED